MSPRHSGPKQRQRLGARALAWGLVVFLVCAMAGYMLVMNINTNRSTLTSYDTRGLLEDRSKRVTNLQDDIKDLSSQIDTINKTLGTTGEGTDDANGGTEASQQNDGSGTVLPKLEGPGLVVTLTDSPLYQSGNIGADKDPNDYVVHQQDLEGVINALWRGGAEAMMIQDQRVLPTTAVRCKGNVLLLQGKSYAPPFTVSAIGPTDRMQKALDDSPTIQIYKEYVDSIGLGWNVQVNQSLEFPEASSALQALNYAQPIEKDKSDASSNGSDTGTGSSSNESNGKDSGNDGKDASSSDAGDASKDPSPSS